ncbi:glycosyltransferase [Vibrio sp. Of7-15]|uniref:glycosyltransferase family 2 protein n=1 Tax=Vibrio sp. Of7-15 TaxID=2724879 RepID=UPI001EF2F608|nr:glycosyltransferase [Vibrio sp. Of7-15]MCG7496853.1 glycosyltransferase [Vibrio sp. Of7-15]
MNKKLSIIIVTYNSIEVIEECLNSIEKYNDIGSGLEVLIVDNSPVFEINDFVSDLKLDLDIKLIHNPKNGGFGQGNNIGVKASNGELLLILNADTILVEPVFSYILDKFEDETLTAAGFKLVGRDGKVNNSFALFPEYNYFYFIIPLKLLYFFVLKFSMLSKLIFPWGADFVVRKNDFIEAGMFDEKIFLCNEEPDLTKRLGGKVRIFNKPIIHLEGHTTVVDDLRFNEWLLSTRYYFSKYNLDFDKFIKVEIKLNRLKIKIKKLLGHNVEHLVSYVNMIEDRMR